MKDHKSQRTQIKLHFKKAQAIIEKINELLFIIYIHEHNFKSVESNYKQLWPSDIIFPLFSQNLPALQQSTQHALTHTHNKVDLMK